MTSRVRRVLELVEQLELAPAEVHELREELIGYEGCEVNLAGADEDEKQALLTVKRRVDQFLRGEAQPVTLAQANAFVRAELRTRRQGKAKATIGGTPRQPLPTGHAPALQARRPPRPPGE